MNWAKLLPGDPRNTARRSFRHAPSVTHWPPLTACESVEVAMALRSFWENDVAQTPGAVLAPTDLVIGAAWLDLGGIARVDRKIYDLDLGDGLNITVPARDVEDYINIIKSRQERPEEIDGKLFLTIPAMHVNVFLSLPRVAILLDHLQKILPEASAIATAENDHFNKSFVDDPKPNVVAPRRRTGPMGEA